METIVMINGFAWKVFFVEKTHQELIDEKGEQNAYGITTFRECEIYIDYELPDGLMKKTIVHELMHAIAFSYGVNLNSYSEEDFCDFIGAHFDELKTLRKAVLKVL